jgi:hypothetical protein
MANISWIDEVRQRLARHALPPAYIRRFMEELSDHLEDLKEENMSTDAGVLSRLGDPNQVADAAVVVYRRRSFLGRHPAAAFLVFGVSPMLTMIALFFLTLAGVSTLVSTVRPSQVGPFKATLLCCVESLLTLVIPSIIASILYCKLAKRLGIGRRWMVTSCVVLAAIALAPSYWWTNHWWTFGFLGWNNEPPRIQHLVQLIGPLVTCWWFMRRKHDRGQAQLAS